VTFENANDTVLSEVRTKEQFLSDDDYALYEYNKKLQEEKYPLFVLNYVGEGNMNAVPKGEITWGLNDIERRIQEMKATTIREMSERI
jgi:hypothetical protein